jgi:protein-arginine kinase activator protein McsA
MMARLKTKVARCRVCKLMFEQLKQQNHYACTSCRTPEKMVAAGYGREDIHVEANVSYERARVAVFGPDLKVKAS